MGKEEFIEVQITNSGEADLQVIMALLENIGFEGFDESGNELKAYITAALFDETQLQSVVAPFHLSYQTTYIAPQNWNAVWENHFEPVIIDDFVAIRAHFHAPVQTVEHEIIITPKMSFGTGHHATTMMMIQQMRALNLQNKRVLDFGTGTGVLAILAEQRGAAEVKAIDNDEWSIENSLENIAQNHCFRIEVQLSDSMRNMGEFDVILANINKNVIIDNLPFIAESVKQDGFLLLSGLLAEDEADILSNAAEIRLHHVNTRQNKQWISLLLKR